MSQQFMRTAAGEFGALSDAELAGEYEVAIACRDDATAPHGGRIEAGAKVKGIEREAAARGKRFVRVGRQQAANDAGAAQEYAEPRPHFATQHAERGGGARLIEADQEGHFLVVNGTLADLLAG